ncbi:MAG TPA: plastocyanin/azurin family copper-binding protein [Acidimicrobiia bacterium]
MKSRSPVARRARGGALLLAAALLVGACGSSGKSASPPTTAPWWKGVKVVDMRGKAENAGEYPEVDVDVTDNRFTPSVLRVDPGTTVSWTNHGKTTHDILKAIPNQDFGKQFGTDTLSPTANYEFRFDKPGVYRYYCSFHGSETGGMVGLVAVGDVDIDTGQVSSGGAPTHHGTLRVPQQYSTIQAAVNAAAPGALVLVSPGVYHEAVQVLPGHENIVLRGTDRNKVILDGQFDTDEPNGVTVQANGVAIENMTARNYVSNGFYWRGVTGYRGSYLTSYRTGDYGIYAFDSEVGQFDHDLGIGSRDASFYIGQCRNCRSTITDSVGEWSGIGYSGTNAGGDLILANNVFHDNRVGIVPNSESGEELSPQRDVVIVGNRVYSNNNIKTPAIDIAVTAEGNGILVAGGNDDLVEHNLVYDQSEYGIGVIPLPEKVLSPSDPKSQNFEPSNNTVRDNNVSGSKVADLGLVLYTNPKDPAKNCFANNVYGTTSPAHLEQLVPCGAPASSAFVADIATLAKLFLGNKPKEVDYKSAPLPSLTPQTNMPDPMTAPARPANTGLPVKVDVASITTPTR